MPDAGDDDDDDRIAGRLAQLGRTQRTSVQEAATGIGERALGQAKGARISRTRAQGRAAAWASAGTAVAVGIFLWSGGPRDLLHPESVAPEGGVPRSLLQVALQVAAGGSFAALLLWFLTARGRSMLGRPTNQLIAGAFAAPLGMFLFRVGISAAFEDGVVGWPDRVGVKCLGMSLAMSVSMLTALFAIRWRSDPVHPVATGIALGAAAGTAGSFLTDLWCPVGEPLHVLLGHVVPILICSLIGGVVARRTVELR